MSSRSAIFSSVIVSSPVRLQVFQPDLPPRCAMTTPSSATGGGLRYMRSSARRLRPANSTTPPDVTVRVAIDGVPGTSAPISLDFVEAVGSKTGKLLPTGRVRDTVDGIEVSCVDLAMPMVIARAADFGKTGAESRDELNADSALFARIEPIRRAAAKLMGMGDATGKVVPKFCLVSPPRAGGTIMSRYFVPDSCHSAHAVTGTLCLAAACGLPGSITDGIAELPPGPRRRIVIEHPSGSISAEFELEGSLDAPVIRRAALVRTARKLMEGQVFIPATVWSGQQETVPAKAA